MSGSVDFTGQLIQETFGRLLQTTGSAVYDGTGSLAILDLTGSFRGNVFLDESDPALPVAQKGQIYFTTDGRLYIGI
jgi:hypothetical protein